MTIYLRPDYVYDGKSTEMFLCTAQVSCLAVAAVMGKWQIFSELPTCWGTFLSFLFNLCSSHEVQEFCLSYPLMAIVENYSFLWPVLCHQYVTGNHGFASAVAALFLY